MKSGRTFSEEASIPYERYFDKSYFSRTQFDTMVSQILAVNSLEPKTVLEIGPGNGFVSTFLRMSGMKITTFDINENLRPDIVGNLIEIDSFFDDKTFDLVLCAEVLEHLPYEFFPELLSKFANISKNNVIITLPRQHRILLDFNGSCKIPFLNYIHFNLFLRLPNRSKWEEHHWEIDYSSAHSLKKIKLLMEKYYNIIDCFVDKRNRIHQYFILKKKDN